MSGKGWPWDVLDLPRAPETTAEIRRAYAKRLKTIDQAKDIAGFEALREAYENALARVAHKARQATALVDEAPTIPEPAPVLDTAQDPTPTGPAFNLPAIATPEAAPPSTEERLNARLQGLAERNILVSATERVRQILDDPDFQAPELDRQLREGFADYLRSQLLFNHLNEPYLRHPGVTADLLKALDARFGWLSDYSAFHRDFWGDARILEAMIDAAGIDRTPPHQSIQTSDVEPFSLRGLLFPAGLFGFLFFFTQILEMSRGSEPGSALDRLANVLVGAFALAFLAFALYLIYGMVSANGSRRAAIAACIWAVAGLCALLISGGLVPLLPASELPITVWGAVSGVAGFLFLTRTAWRDLLEWIADRRKGN